MKKYLFVITACLFSFFSSSGQWTQVGVDLDGAAAGDRAGRSVAISADGLTVAVGAIFNDGNGIDAGHVRVYKNTAGTWNQMGVAIDGEAVGDAFGWDVSLSDDGTRLAVGAPYNQANGTNTGHARVYEFKSSTWVQISADFDGEAAEDFFGTSVSISGDGKRVAVGGIQNDGNGLNAGHTRVYEESAGLWSQIGSDIDGEAAGDESGRSVALSRDGSVLVIGAYKNDGGFTDAGHMRVYEYNAGSWSQLGADIDGEAATDYSGISVAISANGNRVAMGGIWNDGAGTDAGYVRVYEANAGAWTQLGSDIDGEAAGDWSGISIALSANGNRIAVGALNNDGNGTEAGHVRLFEFDAGAWKQLGSDIDGEAAGDNSGIAVALSSAGSTVAIGAYDNGGNGAKAGHARVYEGFSTVGLLSVSSASMKVSPNPFTNSPIISFDADEDDAIELIVVDQQGRFLSRQPVLVKAGANSIPIDMNFFQEGYYYLKIIGSINYKTIPLIKTN